MGTIDLDSARERMASLRGKLEAEIFAINDSKSLADSARFEVGKAKITAQNQAAAWRDDLLIQLHHEQISLERRAFGIPAGGNPVSHRDATDRVAQLRDNNTASAMLERAVRDNDTDLVRAVARWAYDKGQSQLLDDVSRHVEIPAKHAIDELRQLPTESEIEATFRLREADTSDLSYSERTEATAAVS